MNKKQYLDSRYARFIPLKNIGSEGLDKIQNSRVTIVGCGGLGSVTAFQLAALGVGYLRLIDGDKVELTNLQRQTLYREKDIGKSKALSAKKFLDELNPDVTIEAIETKITADNVHLSSTNVDFIIDALDNFAARMLLNNEALKKNIPYLFGAVSGYNGNAMTIKTGTTCLNCVFGNVIDQELPTTSEVGIHPSIIQIIGSLQVAEATKIMIGMEPELVNKLLFCDINNMQFETISVQPKSNCFCSK